MNLQDELDKWAQNTQTYIEKRSEITPQEGSTLVKLIYRYSRGEEYFNFTNSITVSDDIDLTEQMFDELLHVSENQFYRKLQSHMEQKWHIVREDPFLPAVGVEIDLAYYFPTINISSQETKFNSTILITKGCFDGKFIRSFDEGINFEEYRRNLGLFAWKEL